MYDNEVLIPPSKESALFPFDYVEGSDSKINNSFNSRDYNSKMSNDGNNNKGSSNNFFKEDNFSKVNWTSSSNSNSDKINNSNNNISNYGESRDVFINDHRYSGHDSSTQFKDLEKIDTKSLPNNLFELKHRQLEEQNKVNSNYGNYSNSSSNSNTNNSNRYASISSDPNFRETMNFKGYSDPIFH